VFALDRILFRSIGDHPIVRTYKTPLSRIASDHLPVVARFHVADATGGPRALVHQSELT
jgi:endonuclease/exonuclease/phosphatase family metal-dependent hydrolase